MRFAIYGTGAVGGYYGGRLAQAGHEVAFIARGENLRALQTSGLRVDSTKGDFVLPQVTATDDPASVGPVDVVIPCVKTWQIPQAAEAMRPLVGPGTLVVTVQNGVEAPQQFGEILGMGHMLGGIVKLFTELVAPGHVVHGGGPAQFLIGELDGRMTPRAQGLYAVLKNTQGIAAEITDNIQAALWEKLLMIAAFGSVGAAARAPIGILRSVPETRAMLRACMEETRAVAAAYGAVLDEQAVERAMTFVDTQPAGGTASMQRDVIAGRRSELDSLVGAVVHLGQAAGVAVPVCTSLYASLRPSELRARGELEFSL